MLFVAEIWIDEPNFCNACPMLDLERFEHPFCKFGEFYLRNENIGKDGKPNWCVRRPAGCPLKAKG